MVFSISSKKIIFRDKDKARLVFFFFFFLNFWADKSWGFLPKLLQEKQIQRKNKYKKNALHLPFDKISVLFSFHKLSHYEDDKMFQPSFDFGELLMYSSGKLIALLLFITTLCHR